MGSIAHLERAFVPRDAREPSSDPSIRNLRYSLQTILHRSSGRVLLNFSLPFSISNRVQKGTQFSRKPGFPFRRRGRGRGRCHRRMLSRVCSFKRCCSLISPWV